MVVLTMLKPAMNMQVCQHSARGCIKQYFLIISIPVYMQGDTYQQFSYFYPDLFMFLVFIAVCVNCEASKLH